MIIKIEDAPNIKHIKIDINFDDESDTPTINVVNSNNSNNVNTSEFFNKSSQEKKYTDDIDLDIDGDMSNEDAEKVTIPDIPEVQREANVANDMKDLEI